MEGGASASAASMCKQFRSISILKSLKVIKGTALIKAKAQKKSLKCGVAMSSPTLVIMDNLMFVFNLHLGQCW